MIPVDWNPIQVYATYLNVSGFPASGSIDFVSKQTLVVDGTVVIPRLISCPLDANGYFSVTLPATNSDTMPDWTYLVVENISGYHIKRKYNIQLDANVASVNLADIAPVSAVRPISVLAPYKLSVGVVSTSGNDTPVVTITGNPPNQILNIALPNIGGSSGVDGTNGTNGQIRFTGYGPPGTIVGANPADTYMDLNTGDVYKLS